MTNGTMLQFFHWYIPTDGSLWNHAKDKAQQLADLGFNSVWLPPAYKGEQGAESSGYNVYDIYDLGEFDQKGSVRTKFGTKEEYRAAVDTLHEKGIQVYADIVVNHMGGGDEIERVWVRRVDPENRNEFTSEPFEIDAFTKFTFPGRAGKYSNFIWNYTCFTGVDYAHDLQENAIFSIQNDYGEGWEEVIDTEKGNYDYLMFSDIEFRNKEVREEIKRWGKWYLEQIPFDGVRLDAVKHIAPQFFNEWLDYMRTIKPDLFAVGEYWAPGELPLLLKYIEATNEKMSLFDASLHHNFHNASTQGKEFDLTTILNNSLVAVKPHLAVTVVDNHDTQPLQSLEAPVEAWFKPHAYALILLREGGYPSVFYPDLFGAHYTDKGNDGNEHEIFLDKAKHIEELLMARKQYAYGQQRDYIDHANCIGWTREGVEDQPGSGCAVLLSNGDDGFKSMEVGKQFAGKPFVDMLGTIGDEVLINEDGWGEFRVNAGSIAVWICKNDS
ncbi:MAG: alpha-amylase [Chitinophagaceae bacterium]|nr:MAG: alpha-amylase [Chitinophagaceae bacterium]